MSVWETDYRNDRRKHSHRCKACGKIIQVGEAVLMVRKHGSWPGQRVSAVHIEHADELNGANDSFTWRDAFKAWERPVFEKEGPA